MFCNHDLVSNRSPERSVWRFSRNYELWSQNCNTRCRLSVFRECRELLVHPLGARTCFSAVKSPAWYIFDHNSVVTIFEGPLTFTWCSFKLSKQIQSTERTNSRFLIYHYWKRWTESGRKSSNCSVLRFVHAANGEIVLVCWHVQVVVNRRHVLLVVLLQKS